LLIFQVFSATMRLALVLVGRRHVSPLLMFGERTVMVVYSLFGRDSVLNLRTGSVRFLQRLKQCRVRTLRCLPVARVQFHLRVEWNRVIH
jgi:hypothetical protein